jgi:hydrogenase maturation protease
MIEVNKSESPVCPNLRTTVVAGVGSPFGDDQAGWRLVDLLQCRPNTPARLMKVQEATQLVDELAGCTRLIIVDACRGVCQVGAVTRLVWPDARIARRHSQSTHGVGVCDALRLAEQLGRLPEVVEIFGIEVGECEPGREICHDVLQAVVELEAVIFAELSEVAHA